jgi:hypothetical protein
LRERLAGADDVNEQATVVRGVVGRDFDRPRERHRLTPDDCGERVRTDDAVAAQVHLALQEAHSPERRTVEVRVDGDVDPLAHEHELQHGDVPAELSTPKRPCAEERSSKRPESLACARIGDSGHPQAVNPLESPDGCDGLRSRNRVDGAAVKTLRAKRHLQACRLGVPPRPRGGRGRRESRCRNHSEKR